MRTIDLIERAEQSGQSLREWSRHLGLSPNTLSAARTQGKLSPGVAAALADKLGEDVAQWTLLAVAESERSAPLRSRLASIAQSTAARVRKSLFYARSLLSTEAAKSTPDRGRPGAKPRHQLATRHP